MDSLVSILDAYAVLNHMNDSDVSLMVCLAYGGPVGGISMAMAAEACDLLLQEALHRGSQDNLSVRFMTSQFSIQQQEFCYLSLAKCVLPCRVGGPGGVGSAAAAVQLAQRMSECSVR